MRTTVGGRTLDIGIGELEELDNTTSGARIGGFGTDVTAMDGQDVNVFNYNVRGKNTLLYFRRYIKNSKRHLKALLDSQKV